MLSRLSAATDIPSVPNALAGTQAGTNTAPGFPPSGGLNVIVLLMVAGFPVMTLEVAAVKGLILKAAPTFFAAPMVTVQVPVPVQAPLQPAKVLPLTGVALRITFVPLAKLAKQVAPQSMPVGLLLTKPEPAPDLATA